MTKHCKCQTLSSRLGSLRKAAVLAARGILFAGSLFHASAGFTDDSKGTLRRMDVRTDQIIRKLPITDSSMPFIFLGEFPKAYGYVQEEFEISGNARAYEWTGSGFDVRPISEPGAYATRVIVLRPRDPAKFSGNIDLELINSTRGFDRAHTLNYAADLIMRRGDVYVGLTSKSVSINALKTFDSTRYAGLHWSNPVAAQARCADPSFFPRYLVGNTAQAKTPLSSRDDSEDGLIWDIYAQLGAFLKSDRRGQMLPGFSRPKVFSSGTSQSGMIERTFINTFHPVMRLKDGGPIFDGYLIEVGAASMNMNNCARDISLDDKKNLLNIVDVPVINILSEGDMFLGLHTRQPDDLGPRQGLVTYEIAGGFHGPGLLRFPVDPNAVRGDFLVAPKVAEDGKPFIASDFPRGYFSRAALVNLQRWAGNGDLPPVGAPIHIVDGKIVRDENGNALGGVRSVWLDVPTATYLGSGGTGTTVVIGRKFPFALEKAKALYPTQGDYEGKVKSRVLKMIGERWILPEDADDILAALLGAGTPHIGQAH
jgi:hypothetical protein